MLNPVFWKKVQEQKHPERWEIAERKISSVKMLFKTNTNGHKHPSISSVIIEQDTIGETKENKGHSTQEPRTPKYWTPILNNTPCVSIYMCYNQNSYKECIRIEKCILTQSFWMEQRSWGGNTTSKPHVSARIPRPAIKRMERMCQRHGRNQTPTLLFESKTHKSINS